MAMPLQEMVTSPDTDPIETPAAKQVAGRSPTQIALERLRHDKVAVVSAAVVVLFVVLAILAPVITSLLGVELRAGDPSEDTDAFNFPVIGPPDNGFTWEAPLGLETGTGNDLLAEWLYGARTSLEVASITTLLSTIIGVVLGLMAGFSRGWLDRVISFVIDVFLSFPFCSVRWRWRRSCSTALVATRMPSTRLSSSASSSSLPSSAGWAWPG